jgi:hypothetical protein
VSFSTPRPHRDLPLPMLLSLRHLTCPPTVLPPNPRGAAPYLDDEISRNELAEMATPLPGPHAITEQDEAQDADRYVPIHHSPRIDDRRRVRGRARSGHLWEPEPLALMLVQDPQPGGAACRHARRVISGGSGT